MQHFNSDELYWHEKTNPCLHHTLFQTVNRSENTWPISLGDFAIFADFAANGPLAKGGAAKVLVILWYHQK